MKNTFTIYLPQNLLQVAIDAVTPMAKNTATKIYPCKILVIPNEKRSSAK